MIVETKQLTGAALDWAVAQCEGIELYGASDFKEQRTRVTDGGGNYLFRYSANWAQGGPIIERERIELIPKGPTWDAMREDQHIPNEGPTPLIAAMRCYVASKLGDDVEIPEELK